MSKRPTSLIVVALVVSGLVLKQHAQGIRPGTIEEPPRPTLLRGTTQDKKPDFSGLWVMTSPEVGHQLLIKQDATTFSYGPPDEQGPTMVIKLDGSESRNEIRMGVSLSKATWQGSQLVVTNSITGTQGQKLDQILRWSLDDQGQLQMEVQNNNGELQKMTYKKHQ